MEVQKYEPTQPEPTEQATPSNQSQTTKVNRQAHKLQTTQINRQMDGIFPFLLSAPYLRAYFVPISVPISMPVQVYKHATTITQMYMPLPPLPYLGA